MSRASKRKWRKAKKAERIQRTKRVARLIRRQEEEEARRFQVISPNETLDSSRMKDVTPRRYIAIA